jgi:uncharacterized OsmC-like protein
VVGHDRGTQRLDPLDLLLAGAVSGLKVQVHSVLGDLRLRYGDEQQRD